MAVDGGNVLSINRAHLDCVPFSLLALITISFMSSEIELRQEDATSVAKVLLLVDIVEVSSRQPCPMRWG